MCGRYGLIDPKKLKQRFDLVSDEYLDMKSRYNIAPGQILPVITNQNHKQAEMMKWGLIPFWAKDMSIGYKMINARAEGIEQKPSFRKPFRSQRCLVPASFFYEWRKDGKDKIPYLIRLKNQDIFAFAGLFDIVKDTEGKEIKSYTIITTSPNQLMEKIHDRMPVILSKEDEDLWLNPDIDEPSQLLPLLNPFPAKDMEAYVVGKDVNTPTNDFADLIKPEVNSI